jgi:hypothetical protein
MKRIFLCGFAFSAIAACTTQQTENAKNQLDAIAAGLASIAPLTGAFAPLNASAPVASSAPVAASESTK